VSSGAVPGENRGVPAVMARLKTELRSRWRAWAAVALLIGLAGGVVLTTAAGARRTETAYPRLLQYSRGADLVISPQNRGLPNYYAAVARSPGVADMTVGVGFEGFTPDIHGEGFQMLAVADTHGGRTLERLKLTEGRRANPTRADETVADNLLARRLHLHAGSTLNVQVAPTTASGIDVQKARSVRLHVVGVGVGRDNVVTVNALAAEPTLYATPALLGQFQSDYEAYSAFDGAFVRLRPGVSRAAFGRTAQDLALAPEYRDETGGELFIADVHEQAAAVEHAIRPQAAALALFSLLAALSAVFVVGQILSRQLLMGAGENPTLVALGMGRSQLFLLGLAEAGIVATAGAVLAALVAVVASRFMPIGPARVAEPHPGLAVNWTILGLGVVVIIAVLLVRVAWPVWRLAGARVGVQGALELSGVDRPSRLVEEAARAGAPASAAVGIRLALEPGRGRTAVPVRSALAGTVMAVAAVAAAFTFGTNLVHLVHTPKAYGQTWDLAIDTQFGRLPPDGTTTFLQHEPGVVGWTFGDHGNAIIGGKNVATVGLASGRGSKSWPAVVEGRAPAAPDEIALGAKTMASAHKRIGQAVSATPQGESQSQDLRIVGRAVFPFFGRGTFNPTGLGLGAMMQDPPREPSPDPAGFNFVLVKMAGNAQRSADIARLRRDLTSAGICPQDQVCGVEIAKRPVDILNYTRIQSTPLALAGLLAALAVATIAHLLVTSIRRRRRDLAVLKTMGFVRGQVSAAVAWQATTLVLLALLVGLPLGVAGGRWIWQVFADRIGVAPDPRVPVLMLALSVPVALTVANLLAAGPGWVAGRLKPAPVLRTE
jgi:ABC-type lipoprotein release transport system permease subunit